MTGVVWSDAEPRRSSKTFYSPVLIEKCVSWLGLVLQGVLVHSVRLVVRPPLLQLLCPGQVEGGAPSTHAFTVQLSVHAEGVRVKTRLGDRRCGVSKGLQPIMGRGVAVTYTSDAVADVSDVIRISLNSPKPVHKAGKNLRHATGVSPPLLQISDEPGARRQRHDSVINNKGTLT